MFPQCPAEVICFQFDMALPSRVGTNTEAGELIKETLLNFRRERLTQAGGNEFLGKPALLWSNLCARCLGRTLQLSGIKRWT